MSATTLLRLSDVRELAVIIELTFLMFSFFSSFFLGFTFHPKSVMAR